MILAPYFGPPRQEPCIPTGVILEKKSVTPIPSPTPPYPFQQAWGSLGNRGFFGGMKIERNMGVQNFKNIEKKKNSKFPNLTI